MAYIINRTDGAPVVTVPDRTLQPIAGISLIGRNYSSYGEIIAEDLVRMVENFSNSTAPANPLPGQFWYNPDTQTVSLYCNNYWVPIGGAPTVTGFHITAIQDDSGVWHDAIVIRVASQPIAIISNDGPYTPISTYRYINSFPNINPGINFSNASGNNGDVIYKLHGRAIEAEFADMAEIYTADMELIPGNIVKLGGHAEITKTTQEFDNQVFGIVSTAPGFLLNSKDKLKDFAYPVALKGRVPCVVKGEVRKGQRIVASDLAGVGMAVDHFDPAATVGRAISEKTYGDVGIIEVAVGVR